MKESFRAFMNGIIDYAGLFPPADLSLDPAIRNFAAYRKSDEAWILSRFIIPAARLNDLEAYGNELFKEGEPFRFSILGSGTDTLSEFEAEIKKVFECCTEFKETHGGRVISDLLEIKLPKEAVLGGDSALIRKALEMTAGAAGSATGVPGTVFFEGFYEESWKKDIDTVLDALSGYHDGGAGNLEVGYKLRCGGTEAHMFPEVDKVAYTINACREHNLALKCTAGLHHPVRHYDESVQAKMHGFFNIFGGALLAYAHDLNNEELEEILKEEDPDQFSFSEDIFSWRDLSISSEDISELREVAVISFGSCSFEEPLEDLKKLHLL
jgi:hypothetical protein